MDQNLRFFSLVVYFMSHPLSIYTTCTSISSRFFLSSNIVLKDFNIAQYDIDDIECMAFKMPY